MWRRTAFELATVLTAYDTTAFWVGEYMTDAKEGEAEFAIADGILELRREQSGSRDDRYLRVGKLRGSGFLDGNHAFVITENGLRVFPRLVPPLEVSDFDLFPERLQSGIAGLDEMIETGWLRGTSTLVAGPSGAGKTMLAMHFLREGAVRGEPGLLVNFQENPRQLQRMMSSLGWDPAELAGPPMIDILYSSPVELHVDSIVEEIFRRIEAHGVKRIVVDALADLERSASDPRRFRDYVYALTQHFLARQITTMLVLETFADHVMPATEISYMSDNVLLLARELGEDLTRSIRIVKSRGSAHDGRRHILHIAKGGILVE